MLLTITGFTQKKQADLVVYNAKIYTVDNQFSVEEAMAVKDGKIISIGTNDWVRNSFSAGTELDANKKFIYPGFIDAHAHFLGYGLDLKTVDLTGTKSWEEILDRLKEYAILNKDGWLTGRGWDQNDWAGKQFPDKGKLDSLYPVRPVILTRVDGHAAIVNQAALNIAGIKPGQTIIGGTIETKNGKLTGILVDNAVGIVTRKIPEPTEQVVQAALLGAQKNCVAVGFT